MCTEFLSRRITCLKQFVIILSYTIIAQIIFYNILIILTKKKESNNTSIS